MREKSRKAASIIMNKRNLLETAFFLEIQACEWPDPFLALPVDFITTLNKGEAAYV
jgi:hypothetical protein